MARISFTMMICLFTGLFLGGFVQETQALEKVTKTDLIEKVLKVENLVRVADNVIILFDSSGSMAKPFGDSGMTKIQAAKKIIQQRVDVLPGDFPDLKVGLYTYSPPTKTAPQGKGYDVFYALKPFNKAEFQAAAAKLPDEASGPTLLINALRKLDRLLEGVSGRTVVFLFTDGTHSNDEVEGGPLALAKNIVKKYDVNFQIVSTADVANNKRLLTAVASLNEASRVHSFENLLRRPEVFTGAVFVLEESYIISVESRDEVVGFKLDHILFEYDKQDIDMQFTDELKAVGEILKKQPASYVVLSGHTDSKGPEEYNLALSHRRVEAVGTYLADKFEIDKNRISMFWYGEAAPIASNDTDEGRKENRRVVGFIAGVE